MLQCFSSENTLKNHRENCISINGKQSIKMPKKMKTVFFQNFHKQLAVTIIPKQ